MNGTQSSYFRLNEFGTLASGSSSAGKFHLGLALGVLLMLSSLPVQAQFLTGTVPTGTGPAAIGINPVTNKAYVANASDGTLTIIDGATHSTATIAVGSNPHAVLVNTVTNKIYVANANASGIVTVVDGATNQTTTVAVGGFPSALAVNPATNLVYVANQVASGSVLVIDGVSDSVVATLSVGGTPSGVAVDSSTNRIYVANSVTDSVTVVNGADNSTSSISTGTGSNPVAVAVNSATGKVYVACRGNGSVEVIDENTNLTSAIVLGATVWTLALDPVTGRVYALLKDHNQLAVINGASNSLLSVVAVGASPVAVAINTATHQVYTANSGDGTVTIIDAATLKPTNLTVGANPGALGIDSITNKAYLANEDSSTVSVVDGATNTLATVSLSASPVAIAAHVVADKVYVGSLGGNSVTVIDGATNTTTDVPAGNSPQAFASSPLTNKVYVANVDDQTVTVIDGATSATTTINLGASPRGIAVNPATNRVYVSTTNKNTLTVIDGTTGSIVAAIPLGSAPATVAVDAATNTIYATNPSGNSLVVLDGATHAVTTVGVGDSPRGIAVNSSTHRVYVVNETDNTVTVIDGMTANVLATVAVGNGPRGVAVNSMTNRVYVANQVDSTVTVIDGVTNSATLVTLGNLLGPIDLAVNPVSNKVYVAGQSSNNIAIIDGASNAITILNDANAVEPFAVAVDALTGKVYVANRGSSNVTVLTEQQVSATLLQASVLPLAANLSATLAPHLEFAASRMGTLPTAPPRLEYQIDSWQGAWRAANTLGGARFDAASPALAPGFHVLYAFSSDGQSASSSSPHTQSNSLNSNIVAYGFTVSPPSIAVSTPRLDFGSEALHKVSVARSVILSNLGGGPLTLAAITATGDYSVSHACGTTVAPSAQCEIPVTFTPSAAGARLGTLTVTQGSGESMGHTISLSLVGTAAAIGPPTFSPNPLPFATAQVAGTKSSAQTATLTNNTGGTLTITSFSTASAPDFTATPGGTNPCGTTLADGASCTVSITFAPTLLDTLATIASGTNGLLPQAILLTSSYTTAPVGLAVSGTAQAFGFNTTTPTATVTAGQTGSFPINVVPVGGYNQSVSFSCITAATNATCNVNPGSVTLDGTHSGSITASVITTARTGLAPQFRTIPPAALPRVPVTLGWLSLAALLGMALALRRMGRLRLLLLPVGLSLILTWAACGGSSTSIPVVTGTAAGSWVVTVTGTSGSLTNTTAVTLNVN